MQPANQARPSAGGADVPGGRGAGFRGDVQGLRAVAVLAVIAYHADGLLPGGYVGVDVFFVISGFVIMRSLLSEHDRSRQVGLLGFYKRRVLRLAPTLAFVTAVTVVVTPLLAPISAARQTLRTGVAAALSLANLELLGPAGYFGDTSDLNALTHTWSLSLEEQFYLVFPLLVVGLLWLSRRPRWTARVVPLGLTLVGVASLLFMLELSHGNGWGGPATDGTQQLAFFLMPARMWQFIAGAVLAHALRDDDARLAAPGAGPFGALLVLGSFVAFGAVDAHPNAWATVPTLGTVLLLANPRGLVADLLRRPAAVRMGDRSYSWYLWHLPAMVFAAAAGIDAPAPLLAVGLATYGLAVLTHRGIEERYRHGLRRSSSGRAVVRPVLASLAAVGLLGAGLLLVPEPADLDSSDRVRAASTEWLDSTCDAQEFRPFLEGCTFGPDVAALAADNEILDVVLVGDSNAASFSDAVVAAGDRQGWRTTVLARHGCAVLPSETHKDGEPRRRCNGRTGLVLEQLTSAPPDVVVLVQAIDVFVNLPDFELRSGELSGTAAYERDLRDFTEQLQAQGTAVVLVHPVPRFEVTAEPRPGGATGGCSLTALRLVPGRCGMETPRAAALALRAPVVAVEQRVTAATGITTLDVFDQLCPAATCSEVVAGTWAYRDATHLSVAGASLLEDDLVEAVEAAAG
jgi:peptidoglycan/LPS O-acetylase OafA/YrhL